MAGAVAERLEGLELEAVDDLWAPFASARSEHKSDAEAV